jgi:hypothetical protein
MAMSLGDRLQLKGHASFDLIHVPEGYAARLSAELSDIRVKEVKSAKSDAVLLFVSSKSEVQAYAPPMLSSIEETALVWIAYPKGGSSIKTDVNRDILWKTLEDTGWRPVRQIALDETWSAMRFRPVSAVESKKTR